MNKKSRQKLKVYGKLPPGKLPIEKSPPTLTLTKGEVIFRWGGAILREAIFRSGKLRHLENELLKLFAYKVSK